MDFSKALELLKEGKRLCRSGWNGKRQFIQLQVPTQQSKMSEPYIYITVLLDSHPYERLVPWIASQTDLLSLDWEISNIE